MPREARRLRFPRGVCVGGMRWESGNVASGRVGGTLQTARRNAATGRWQKDGMLDEWLGSSPQVVRSFQQCSLPDRSRASNQNEGSDACACHDTNNQRKAERGLPGSLFMGIKQAQATILECDSSQAGQAINQANQPWRPCIGIHPVFRGPATTARGDGSSTALTG